MVGVPRSGEELPPRGRCDACCPRPRPRGPDPLVRIRCLRGCRGRGGLTGPDPVGARGPAAGRPGRRRDRLGAVELRSQDVVSGKGDLVDVVATGSGVRFSPAGVRAQQLAIDATIPFATVAEQVAPDVTVYDAGNGKTGVQRQVTLLGQDITLRATGTVSADGGQLLIEPETVDLGGPSFLDSAAERPRTQPRHHPTGRGRSPRGHDAHSRPGDSRGLRRPAQRFGRGHRAVTQPVRWPGVGSAHIDFLAHLVRLAPVEVAVMLTTTIAVPGVDALGGIWSDVSARAGPCIAGWATAAVTVAHWPPSLPGDSLEAATHLRGRDERQHP